MHRHASKLDPPLYSLKLVVFPHAYGSTLTTLNLHINYMMYECKLVGGFNPFEKYDRQIGPFPRVGLNIRNI